MRSSQRSQPSQSSLDFVSCTLKELPSDAWGD